MRAPSLSPSPAPPPPPPRRPRSPSPPTHSASATAGRRMMPPLVTPPISSTTTGACATSSVTSTMARPVVMRELARAEKPPPPPAPSLLLPTATASASIGPTTGFTGGAALLTRKVTVKRPRNPKRFVVTDLPDHPDEFIADTPPPSDSESAKAATSRPKRVGKTEVRGRFTITDLSPESPQAVPRANCSRARVDASLKPAVPRRAELSQRRSLPARPRPFERSLGLETGGSLRSESFAESTGMTALPTSTHPSPRMPRMASVSGPARYTTTTSTKPADLPMPADANTMPRWTDLGMLDRQLAFLQKECAEMKIALEETVTSNACWIEALTQRGLSRSSTASSCTTARTSEFSDGAFGYVHQPSIAESPDNKYRTLQLAYMDLEDQYHSLLRKNHKLEENSVMLEARVEQERAVNDRLRAQLEQLTQYTESLIVESEALQDRDLFESELSSVHGTRSELSSVDVDAASSVADLSSDNDSRYEATSVDYSTRRHGRCRLQDCPEHDETEAVSDTSSERSPTKSSSSVTSQYQAKADNNNAAADVTDTDGVRPSDVSSPGISPQELLLDSKVPGDDSKPHQVSHLELDGMRKAPVLEETTRRGGIVLPPNNQLNHELNLEQSRGSAMSTMLPPAYSYAKERGPHTPISHITTQRSSSLSPLRTYTAHVVGAVQPRGHPSVSPRDSRLAAHIALSHETLQFHNTRVFTSTAPTPDYSLHHHKLSSLGRYDSTRTPQRSLAHSLFQQWTP